MHNFEFCQVLSSYTEFVLCKHKAWKHVTKDFLELRGDFLIFYIINFIIHSPDN